MFGLQRFFTRGSSYMLSVFRIVTALLFMQHGGQKLLNFPPSGMPPMALDPMTATAGGLELIGGLLLLIGLFVRPTAFVLAGEMAVAYFTVHFPMVFKDPMGIFPIINKGELAVLFCFSFLYLLFSGAGKMSLDHLIGGEKII